jgi:hypothetical protein
MPYICRAANAITPDRAADKLAGLAGTAPLGEMNLDPAMMPAYAAAGAAALASFLAAGLLIGPLAVLLALAAIGPFGGVGDPVTLGAFSLAVWAIRSNRNKWFWVAFALASLNRETAPLMLLWWVLSGRSILKASGALIAWAVLRGILALVYEDNSMSMCWSMLERNLKMIQPISATTLVATLVAWALILRGLREQPDWFRWGYWTGAVLLVGMAILWSRPERLRVYLEILPLAAIAMQSGLNSIIGGRADKR